MKAYKHTKTIGGEEFKISSNKRERVYTIVTKTSKYRTYPMTKTEFLSCSHNTGNDWAFFLRGSDYYILK